MKSIEIKYRVFGKSEVHVDRPTWPVEIPLLPLQGVFTIFDYDQLNTLTIRFEVDLFNKHANGVGLAKIWDIKTGNNIQSISWNYHHFQIRATGAADYARMPLIEEVWLEDRPLE
ncbi:hypothetical protein ABEB36_003202 [Hypothenemus hampei]|uniref:Uncharacterized protein n=1 Tax=Hypothenemus hampei TaxID=57062 RepID=A0ABD1FC11_HYPHA